MSIKNEALKTHWHELNNDRIMKNGSLVRKMYTNIWDGNISALCNEEYIRI